jgi:hypothetical protein
MKRSEFANGAPLDMSRTQANLGSRGRHQSCSHTDCLTALPPLNSHCLDFAKTGQKSGRPVKVPSRSISR